MRLRKSAVAAVVCALLAGVSGDCAGASAPARGPVADLLKGRDWAHFAGGKPTRAGVRVTHLDRRITRQDGTGGQPNPPVNLRGPHMVFRGDVRIEASLRRTDDTDAYLHLYGETPVIYDEWRYERRGVRIGVVGGRLRIDRWDGDSDRPAVTRTLGGGLGREVRLALEVRGSRLVVEADGRVVGTVPARDVFGRGRIWFGADAGARGRAGPSAISTRSHWAGAGCPSWTRPACECPGPPTRCAIWRRGSPPDPYGNRLGHRPLAD